MKKQLVVMLFFLFVAGVTFPQTNPKPPVKKPLPALEKLLTGSGLPCKMVNYSNLTEALPGKIDDTKYKYLLQQNDHFDVVKIAVSAEDNTVYLRTDLYKSATDAALLKRVIAQVANVTNIIGGDLK